MIRGLLYDLGARFGPRYIRSASTRLNPNRAFNWRALLNPFNNWAKVIDCEDIPVTPYENFVALNQLTEAYLQLGANPVPPGNPEGIQRPQIPKLITLGGDHSISLPALRALHRHHGKRIAVVHFDAHLDTWIPSPHQPWNDINGFNHGSMFWMAWNESLLLEDSLIHAGLRSRLGDAQDWVDDTKQGWKRIYSDDIDDINGTEKIINFIVETIGTEHPTYLTIDIDVLDPTVAPGTGTPEVGGWSARELIRILRGIEKLNIVGADVVEVAPPFDSAELTTKAAQQLVFEIVTNMVKREIDRGRKPHKGL